jgi:hypothetical protein
MRAPKRMLARVRKQSVVKEAKDAKNARCHTLASLTCLTMRHWQSQRDTGSHNASLRVLFQVKTATVPGQDRQGHPVAL